MMTFALGGLQVWMPTFLHRVHSYSLRRREHPVWRQHHCLWPHSVGSWRLAFRSAAEKNEGRALPGVGGQPGPWHSCDVPGAVHRGKLMIGGMFAGGVSPAVNTGPLNAAVINAVGPHVRAMALAVNIFIFHLLGDVPSAYLIGYMSDKLFSAVGLRRASHRHRPLLCHTVLRDEIRSAGQRRRVRRNP